MNIFSLLNLFRMTLICLVRRYYTRKFWNKTANPKNARKPITSVTVVKMMFELWAGSKPILFITMGIDEPERPAKTRFNSIPRNSGVL